MREGDVVAATPRLRGPARSLTPSPALRRRRRLGAAYARLTRAGAQPSDGGHGAPISHPDRAGCRRPSPGRRASRRTARTRSTTPPSSSPPQSPVPPPPLPPPKKNAHTCAHQRTPRRGETGGAGQQPQPVAALASALAECGHLRDVAQLLLDVAGNFLLRRRREAVPPAPKPSPHPRPGQRQRRQNGIVGTRLLSGRHS